MPNSSTDTNDKDTKLEDTAADTNPVVGSSFANTKVNDDSVSNASTGQTDDSTTPFVPSDQSSETNPSSTFGLDPATPPSSNEGSNSKKAIATILGVVLLVAGVAAGVLLVNRNAEVRIKAWDCVNYVFEVSEDGVVSVRNGSTRNEPLQKAQVSINGSVVATLDVPALNAGDAATLGNVPVPVGGFSWEVIGTKDCEDSGTYGEATATPTPDRVQAECNEVIAYDENWNQLSSAQLSQLESGDVVRFAINGTASSGSFQKARFTINGTLRPEVTAQRPGSSDYYDEYTIPASQTSFNVSAEIFHSELGWL